MRRNQVRRPADRRRVLAVTGLVLAAAVAVGVFLAYGKLRALWLEQSAVTDMARQVTINSGEMVKGDAIAEAFGLRVGANLAEIDFDAKRRETIARFPNVRDIAVRRRMPGRVEITVEERQPSVRINWGRNRRDTGRVADAEGVVFLCRRNTAALPVVRVADGLGTAPGKRLEGLALTALRLAERAKDPVYHELGVLEVDCSRRDYLLATLGDYSRAKIAWEGMEKENDPASQQTLDERLRMLTAAVRSRVAEGTVTWDATQDGRIHAKGGLTP